MSTTSPNVSDYLQYANIQMAAEAFLLDAGGTPLAGEDLVRALVAGNKRASVTMRIQAEKFAAEWEVLAQKADTATGFSGTLFKNRNTGELVLSFRSTEFVDDAARDSQATNSLEVRTTGWAFGQIADMEAWYGSLREDPLVLQGKNFTVTGYSLGGHLATAFGILRREQAAATDTVNPVDAIYTFNGAGVGQFSTGTLTQAINVFRQARDTGSAGLFTSSSAQQLYATYKSSIDGQATSADMGLALVRITQAAIKASADNVALKELDLLYAAIARAKTVRDEIDRVATIVDSGPLPSQVAPGEVDAVKLDYQLAVLTASKFTNAFRASVDLEAYDIGHDIRWPADGLDNVFDLYGDSYPSAVSNSQIHYGKATPIWIENQPTKRGSLVWSSLTQSLLYSDTKLLVDNFSQNNFGDTHSLVLLVDSLSVQDVLARLDSTLDAERVKVLFNAASNAAAETGFIGNVGPDNQGKADGDTLERVVNALGALLGREWASTEPLVGSTAGGTWADVPDRPDQTSGRAKLHERLRDIAGSDVYKSLAGKAFLQPLADPTAANLVAQAKARVDFQTVATLQTLSPFVLNEAGSDGAAALDALWNSPAWSDQYSAWLQDKSLLEAGKDPEAFTDRYLADRGFLLQMLVARNAQNIPDGVTVVSNLAPNDRMVDLKYFDFGSSSESGFTTWSGPRGNVLATPPHQLFFFDGDTGHAFAGTNETKFGDHLYGGGGDDTISGLNGDDYLEGNAGKDVLGGGKGYDTLLGGASDDTLVGGEGHDLLLGGSGSDTYYFEGNVGLDIVRDRDGAGRIVVGAPGFQPLSGGKKLAENTWISDDGKFTYALVEGNLVIRPGSDSGATGFITVQGWKGGDLGITLDDTPANSVAPANKLVGDFIKKENESGTAYVIEEGNYVPDGSDPGALDLINGGSGADWIQGLGGQDALFGQGGDDVLEGGDGGDVLFGGLGSDTLRGGSGIDFIYGSDAGSTTYPTLLQDPPAGSLADDFIPGFDWSFWGFQTDPDGYRQWHYSPDELTIVRQTGDTSNVIEGGAGNDVISAGTGSDVVHGDADNDNIVGEDGDDVLFGDDGNDRIFGDASYAVHGRDVLYGGTGNDLLFGQGNDDVVYGGDGDDTLYGDDRSEAVTPLEIRGSDYLDGGAGDDLLHGNEGDDILIGGTGDDTLTGGAGKDIYIINRGDGVDRVIDTKDGNIFRFGAGVTKDNVKLELGSLLIDLGGGDQVHVEGFNPDDAANSVPIDSFEFADGSMLSSDDLLALGFDLDGTASDDTLTGTSVTDRMHGFAGNDVLVGGSGDDLLDGGDGNDTLYAGDGNDTLNGGAGDNVFMVRAGIGATVVNSASTTDVVQFGSGIVLSGIRGAADGELVVLNISPTQTVTVTGNATYRFADGTQLGAAGMAAYLQAHPPYGTTVINLKDANGYPAGSSVRVVDLNGITTTVFAGPDGTGAKVSDAWLTDLGGHGSDTFNADGSSAGVTYNVDGTRLTYIDDGVGDRTQDLSDNQGFKSSDAWNHADGTHGVDQFYANGSSSGVRYQSDGSYQTYTDDGHGNVSTTAYDASGQPIGSGDGTHTYPSTTEVHFADGSYRVDFQSAPGDTSSILYSANGVKLNASWTKSDGTHGNESFGAQGSSSGTSYNADGSYRVFTKNGAGQTTTSDYSARNVLLGSTVEEANGLNKIIAYKDTTGSKTKEVWVHPDGNSGSDLINPLDYNGLPNLWTATLARGPGFYSQWGTADAGESASYDAGSYSEQWYMPRGSYGEFHYRNWSSTEQDSWYLASITGADGREAFYFNVGWESKAMASLDAKTGLLDFGYYELIDRAAGLDINGAQSVAGEKYFGLRGSYVDVGPAQTPVSRTYAGKDGSTDILRDDGQGNVVLTDYNAAGKRLRDMWFHNDGSYGADTYNGDGSSTGIAIEPEGKYVQFAIDTQGHVTQTAYPGTNTIVTTLLSPPPPVISPAPPPLIHLAPTGGNSQSVQNTYAPPDGTVRWTTSPVNGSECDLDVIRYNAKGEVVSRSTVHTDPGYDLAVQWQTGMVGWRYDPAGIAQERYSDDGQGTTQTWRYDAQHRMSGYEVAITGGDGSVTSRKFDAAGHLIELAAITHPGAGQTRVDAYDAAGRLSGYSLRYADGHGNSLLSSYDAAGGLLGFTATIVGASGYQTRISSYDGAGLCTGTVVTTTSPATGAIQTDSYDAGGHLTASVMATQDAAGNGLTVNHNASGAVTSFVRLTFGGNGATILGTYDAQGRKLREDVLQADGTQSNTEYALDGSSLKTTVALDGRYSTYTRDASGDDITASFSADGAKLSDSWTHVNGAHGTDTFNADGSYTGDSFYPDGSHAITAGTSDGQLTTTYRDAAGKVTGLARVASDGMGDVTTTYFDALGKRITDSWTRADGARGTDTFNSGGTISGTRMNPDGTSVSFSGSVPTLKVSQLIADQATHTGDAWSFTVPGDTFAETDWGEMLTYTATLGDGGALPAWLAFDGRNRTFHGTPPVSSVGSVTLKVSVTNAEGLHASDAFALAITQPNHAPVSDVTLPDQTGAESRLFSLQLPADLFTDPDAGDSLTWAVQRDSGLALPAWLSFNSATRTLSGTPAAGEGGSLALRVTVVDQAGASASETFDLDIDRAPVLTQTLSAQFATQGEAWSLTLPEGAITDPDTGDALVYVASRADGGALPSWISFDSASRTFSGTPGNADVGNLSLTITATDTQGLQVSGTFTLAVANVNDAPVLAQPLSNQSANEDGAFNFTVPASTFSDPDAGDTLTYTATSSDGSPLPIWLSFDAASRTFSGTPANNDVGNLSIVVNATDAAGVSASTTFALTVVNMNDAPVVAQVLGDQQVTQGVAWAFTVPAGTFTDPDVGDQLTYTATRSDGGGLPAWLAFDPVTRTVSGTPDDGSAGILALEVIATDMAGASVNQVFRLSIASPQGKTITGTSGNDWLTGTTGNDRIDGLAGTDVLNGGAGADMLYGGAGSDGLDGGAGADQMSGGSGNDVYAVDDVGDTATELAAEGNDTVLSSISFTLPSNIENLVLTGSAAVDGFGNNLPNAIVANGAPNFLRGLGGDDVLSAGAGDDILQGGVGNDFLSGGLGADGYLFGRGDGQDTIVDIDSAAGVRDVLLFGAGISADQLWLRRVNSNLEVSVIGTGDKVTVSGWYADAADHLEVIQLASGQRLLDSQVQNLVQAMASMSPPPMGQTTLSASYQNKLEPLIAANWQ